ncbi:MAG: hypothetical protein EOL97_14950 [Spirochaetia bacterium]|nr:hypothetical protein [Spirochaetia bacterium]
MINCDEFNLKYGPASSWFCLEGIDKYIEEDFYSNKKNDCKENHNKVVRDLENRLRNFNNNRVIEIEMCYSLSGRAHEADVICIARNRRYAYAFEVKSSYGHECKQRQQLMADYELIARNYGVKRENIHLFRVTGKFPDYDIKKLK